MLPSEIEDEVFFSDEQYKLKCRQTFHHQFKGGSFYMAWVLLHT